MKTVLLGTAAVAMLLSACSGVVPGDGTLTEAQTRTQIGKRGVTVPDGYRFVGGAKFDCPGFVGSCGYSAHFTAPAQLYDDHVHMFPSGNLGLPRPLTCADLNEPTHIVTTTVDAQGTAHPHVVSTSSQVDWSKLGFDCSRATAVVRSTCWPDIYHGAALGSPEVLVARTDASADIYVYVFPS